MSYKFECDNEIIKVTLDDGFWVSIPREALRNKTMADTKHNTLTAFDVYIKKNGLTVAVTNNDPELADHIVKCVNMHDELVEVLDSVLDGIKRGYNLGYLENEVEEVLKKAGAL